MLDLHLICISHEDNISNGLVRSTNSNPQCLAPMHLPLGLFFLRATFVVQSRLLMLFYHYADTRAECISVRV